MDGAGLFRDRPGRPGQDERRRFGAADERGQLRRGGWVDGVVGSRAVLARRLRIPARASQGRDPDQPGRRGFSWTPVEHAIYVLYAFERAGAETRRLFVEMTTSPSLAVETSRVSRGGPVVWKVIAVDVEGRPLAATALLDVSAGGLR